MKKVVKPMKVKAKAVLTKTLKAGKAEVSSALNKIEIESHKQAAKHHEDAAKHHYDTIKHLEAGNHKKAGESKSKAESVLSFLHKLWEKI